jgi:UDP-2,3-diacylglucosamine hydrolase
VFFFSDVEIDFTNIKFLEYFEEFLLRIKNIQKTPVVLGDFFEYYVGSDLLNNYLFRHFLTFLQKNSINFFLIPGNREALIKNEPEFMSCNFYILNKNVEVEVDGKFILFTHGDEILDCDRGHLLFKKGLSYASEHKIEEKIPFSIKVLVAKILRRISKGNTKKKKNLLSMSFLSNLQKYDAIVMGHYSKRMHIKLTWQSRITNVYIVGKWEKDSPLLSYDGEFKWIKI